MTRTYGLNKRIYIPMHEWLYLFTAGISNCNQYNNRNSRWQQPKIRKFRKYQNLDSLRAGRTSQILRILYENEGIYTSRN